MEILVAYKVLSNNKIKDARISVPMALTTAKALLAVNKSDFALVNVETMLTALESLKGRVYIPGTATFSEPGVEVAESAADPKLEPKRRWLNVDLKPSYAIMFRKWLADIGIKYETSGNGNLTHFEVFLSEEEKTVANIYLDSLRSIVD